MSVWYFLEPDKFFIDEELAHTAELMADNLDSLRGYVPLIEKLMEYFKFQKIKINKHRSRSSSAV